MPKGFDDCRRKGGRVRTEKPSADTYRPVCYDGQGRHPGHVHRKQQTKSAAPPRRSSGKRKG